MANGDWRIGVLFSSSGVTAAAEMAESNATRLAVEEINAAGGVLGRQITPVFYDPECSAKKYQDLAVRLLAEDRIKIIFGCYMSSARKAVLPEIEAYRGMLFYPTFYEGFEYSTRCFYTGSSSNQNAVQLARYLIENYGTRFLLVGSNYVFPYEYNRVVMDLVTRAKGTILNELYVPVEAVRKDFDRVIKQIGKLKPDIVVSTVVGTGAVMLYEAYKEAGFDVATMPIASLTTTEAEVAEMAPSIAAGHLTSASFFETLDTPQARLFVSAYKQRFGPNAPVTAGAEAAYFQVHLYAKALELAGSDEPEALAKHLAGLEFDAPQGRIRIDPDNHHTELWSRIGRVNAEGKFDVIWQSETRVRPDPYFVTASFDDWMSKPHQLKRKA
ncbi:transporter substrate-binding domain-containing protein [Aminobacter aganoensis]|uniref:Branched-chain amino acid transport system substrate-binding protein n=1 Tax=Aminobacter aganoensis TaxID=83264 RepID=A0A7X0FD69_9HYPH|nr:transporter substrate-binding domain-containing protein [Aminobacter aganoensis]MBB6357535.1 branched-chain amino acid transport system substrate-binding protein [Aminobacter aganoensis]